VGHDTSERYKDFPPGWGHLRIPTSSRTAALAALSLYAPCRPRAFLLQRAAWTITKLIGPRALPGRAARWVPGVPPDVWSAVTERVCQAVGSFDSVAGYDRLQGSRSGFALLLLREAVPVAFVKVRAGDSAAIENECKATELVWRHGPRSFRVPRPLTSASFGNWHFLAVEALVPRLHRPARAPSLDAIVGEVQTALSTLPRARDVPAHWRPMHGDLAPWNLRHTGKGELVLIDWEDAAWGPPGGDEVFYQATQAALGIRQAPVSPHEEAIDYWLEKVETRRDTKRDRRLAIDTSAALRRMRPGRSY
jgi:phosphotransferase family enzyme